MSGYRDDYGGAAYPSGYVKPFTERVPPKEPAWRDGSRDALALPTSIQRRQQMQAQVFENLTIAERREAVIRLLDGGKAHRRDIVQRLRVGKSKTLNNTLELMRRDDHVESLGNGYWQLKPAARRQEAPSPIEPQAPEDSGRPAVAQQEQTAVTVTVDTHEVQQEGAPEDSPAAPDIRRTAIDPARIGILSDGALLLESADGSTVEVSPRAARAAYNLLDSNVRWLLRIGGPWA